MTARQFLEIIGRAHAGYPIPRAKSGRKIKA